MPEVTTPTPHERGTVRSLFEQVSRYAATTDERDLIDLAFRAAFGLHPDYWGDFTVQIVEVLDPPPPCGTMNVGSAGSSARQSAVCGTSRAQDNPAEIGVQGFKSPPALPATYVVTDGQRDYLTVDATATDNAWFYVTAHWPRRVRILDGHNGPAISEGVLPGGEGALWLTRRAEPHPDVMGTSAQSAATDAGRSADAPGPYPSSALPSDGE